MSETESVEVIALINLPQYGLNFGESGEIDIDPKDLKGRLALGHVAKVKAPKEDKKPDNSSPSSDG